jgi:hypothetical protein
VFGCGVSVTCLVRRRHVFLSNCRCGVTLAACATAFTLDVTRSRA